MFILSARITTLFLTHQQLATSIHSGFELLTNSIQPVAMLSLFISHAAKTTDLLVTRQVNPRH